MMKNKKGTHVGMILSFLVFVTFLAFLYSVTQPLTQVKRDKLDLIEYLEVELLKEFSEDLSTITINLTVENCISISNIDSELLGMAAVVKDDNENIINSSMEGEIIKVDTTDQDILKFYYSNEFKSGSYTGSCDLLEEGEDYSIRLFRIKKEIFKSKIIKLLGDLESGLETYENLKERLGVPFGDEFGFTFKDSNKEPIAGTEEKEVSTNIYVHEIPIQYIDNEANINPGFLSIRVW